MVRKYGKGGVRSGNTLRAYNSKFNRVYKRQGYIVKTTQNVDPVTEAISKDWRINCDGIKFSLNRKGRWVIPRLLKDQIFKNKDNVYTGISKTVVESHNINRHAKCVEFCSTQRGNCLVLPNKKTYFNVKSIEKDKNKRFKSKVSVDNDNTESFYPNVKFEIVYPCPMTSSLMHNQKYTRENWKEFLQEKKAEKRQRGRGNVSRNKFSKFTDQCIEDYELRYVCRDKYDIEYEDECSNITKCFCETTGEPLSEVLFKKIETKLESGQMILKFGNSAENTKQRRNRKVCIHQTKSDNKKMYPEMLPVYIIISSADVSPSFLRKLYGGSYIECLCFPRKFIIDITDKVSSDTSKLLDFSAFVVFEYDMTTSMNVLTKTDMNIYKVYLNLKSKLKTVHINTIQDFQQMNVDKVIQRTLFFVETIPLEYCYSRMLKKRKRGLSKKIKFRSLEACLGNQFHAYCPSEIVRKEILVSHGEDSSEKNTQSEFDFDCVPPENCPVCFESILYGEKSVTALQSCGHWFCNECWMGHIIGRADTGYNNLTCPQYQCDISVDRATLMSLVNVDFVLELESREHDSEVYTNKLTKWCPNPICGRVITVEDIPRKSMNIKCVCGFYVCFDCLEQAHWPASCEIAKLYATKLLQSGVSNVSQSDFSSQFTVYGKHCPKCFRFIEKYGGCNTMVCCCGIKFCWACLTPKARHSLPYCEETNDRANTIKIKIRTFMYDYVLKYGNNSELHKTAVRHRACQNSWKTQIMKSNKWIIFTKLKRFIIQNFRKTGCTSKFDQYLETKTVQETIEKIPTFLSDIVDLYLELNYIAEYTAVYLQDRIHQYDEIYPVLKRMDILSKAIYKVFQSGKDQDIELVIPEFWEIKKYSALCIEEIVRIVSSPEKFLSNGKSNSDNEFDFV